MKTFYLLAMAACLSVPALAAEKPVFSFELGGTYNIAGSDLFDDFDKVDTWGGDLTAVCHLNDHHAITLRFGYANGDETKSYSEYLGEDFDYIYFSDYNFKAEVSSFSLMPGYRYTFTPEDKVSVYLGANVGLNCITIKGEFNDEWDIFSQKERGYGFGYSLEVGVNYAFSDRVSVFAAYQFSGSTAQTSWDVLDVKSKKQIYNTFRVGLGFKF